MMTMIVQKFGVQPSRTPYARLALLVALGALTACTMVPKVEAPAAPSLPNAWWHASATAPGAHAGANATGTEQAQPWWHAAHDERLNALITQALDLNRDLARYALRYQQQVVQADLTAVDRWPRPSLQATYSASKQLESSGGGTVTVQGVTIPLPDNSGLSKRFGANVGASYEPDLWGRIAANVRAAKATAESARADIDAARWLMTTQIAEQYWSIAFDDAQLALAQGLQANQQELVRIARARWQEGKGLAVEVVRMETALADTLARVSAFRADRARRALALANLVGIDAKDLRLPHAQVPERAPPALNWGQPASLLERRPDLRSARLAVEAALARRQSAEAARYPSLSLTLGLGTGGAGLADILSTPIASLTSALVVPLVDWQRLGLNRDLSQLQLEEAALNWRDLAWKALAEVQTAAINQEQASRDLDAARTRLDRAARDATQARSRFDAGSDGKQTWLDAQTGLLNAQMALLDQRQKLWNYWIATHKAMGGPI